MIGTMDDIDMMDDGTKEVLDEMFLNKLKV